MSYLDDPPAVSENVPAWQDVQSVIKLAPNLLLYVPAGHIVHVDALDAPVMVE